MYNPNLQFHFTGIGGSGMSGIAEILINLGFKVSGSDLSFSSACKRLEGLGAVITQGHKASNLPQSASLLVYSSAVSLDNPELREATERGIPVVPRAAVLAELVRLKFSVAVAGSHGKTTTTSMLAGILEKGELDPTVIIGGQVQNIGSGARCGKGAYLVAEADESDRSFLLLKPTIAIVTNIDREHMDSYDSFDDLRRSFAQFVKAVPFYGLAVLGVDDAEVSRLAELYHGRKMTYGFSESARLRAVNIVRKGRVSAFDVFLDDEVLSSFELPFPGDHLISNSLAAIAVGLEFGIEIGIIKDALADLAGVKRRLEVLHQGDDLTIISDYGHHPTEIAATIQAVRSGWCGEQGHLHLIFEPHRYTRTRDCFDRFVSAFNGSDYLYLSDIYSAGESEIVGIDSKSLLKAVDHPAKQYAGSVKNAWQKVSENLKRGDTVLFLGAGSVGKVAEELARNLKA